MIRMQVLSSHLFEVEKCILVFLGKKLVPCCLFYLVNLIVT